MAYRMIRLTSEQREAVEYDGDLLLTACPGSGKTRVILAKLLTLADQVVGTPQFIGCITYTNAAVDEIETRLRTYGNNTIADRCEISTIHAFCLQFILRPYSWLLPEVPAAFQVLSRENSQFEQIVTAVEDAFGRMPAGQVFEDYESLRIDVNGDPCGQGIETGIVTEASATLYWERVRAHGYLDFAMILYYSWKILEQHPFVARGIASRFAWLLIDEFQDTTDIQIAIFGALQDFLHTRFFLVGDQNQSIMRFAGARPELADQFGDQIGAHRDTSLTGNFRCGPAIVDTASTLIPTVPAMQSVGHAAQIAAQVNYVHVSRPIDAITDYFLPALQDAGIPLGKAAILAPWWTHLIPVARALRELDVPVFGPGARPYRRRRLLAGLAEQLGACAEAGNYLGLPGVERALFRLIGDLTGESRYDMFSYQGRRVALGLIYLARGLADQHPGGVAWLRAMAHEAGHYLENEELLPGSAKQTLIDSAEEMLSDMQASNVDLPNLLISDMGLFANPEQALKLITLHNSKGREFDGVALISMNNGSIPHFSTSTQEAYDESRRLFYVGLTRAKRILLVASDQSHWRNRPTPFIAEAGFG
ncbi:ATP-dependent helicase [Rhizobium leguminosarum]|uniref:ATP-dependent helicase n=1 Tax=Rhizobium leguminosarum TaxID=384 RepID=UPI0028C48511|nr:ATP-dependent helicase [Rhizobium leguminosarum]